MKKIFTLTLILITGLYSCSSNSTSRSSDSIGVDEAHAVVRKPDSVLKKTDTTVTDTAKAATKVASSETGKWTYTDEVDKMTSKKTYFATIDANELLKFPAPYDGGSTATILIRSKRNSVDAILSVSSGQFITKIDGGTVTIRFDDAPAITFSTSEPSDGSTTSIFINNSAKFLKKLKTANKIIVEAEFYESGLKTMEFDVKGFQWAH